MAKLVREVMTDDPACCAADTKLDHVAALMVDHDCGEIPVVDNDNRVIGVVTDRDIVCRVVADSRNPAEYTAADAMSQPAVTVSASATIKEAVSTMERHQIRRVPVVDEDGHCAGMMAQADVARFANEGDVADLVREVSRER